MDTPCGEGERHHAVAVMRRGSYDDSAASLRPHLRNLAHRRRSAPSLAFGKVLGMPWSSIREEASCWSSVDQCPFILGLSSENGELLLDQRVPVTEGNKTKDRHLFLFSDALVFAKLKSSASYRLKHRVSLGDLWVYGFNEDHQEDDEDDEDAGGDVDTMVTLVLAWAYTFCMVSFCSPAVKERWLDTLNRKIIEARTTSGVTTPTPHALMKVLSGSIAVNKTGVTGVGMEPFVEFQSEDDAKISAPCKPPSGQEDRLTQPIENGGKWNILRRMRKSFTKPESDCGTQLFGQPLCKISPDDRSLPKPVTDLLLLLWKKGPSTEGVFRRPGNNRITREAREQLDAGLQLNLQELPVVLLVALLKCFLKDLPGSLLVSQLYDRWVEAMDEVEGQQRSSQIKSVLAVLPVHNRLLLQQLLAVLHRILEHSDTNKMDARNLAVCIAPTLLQLNATPLEEQDKLEKVTELTQYLIEHCCELLGDDFLHLLGDDVLHLLGETDKDNSDLMSSQLNDSAYDITDLDADGDSAEGAGSAAGSSRSLPCSTTATAITPSCVSQTAFQAFTKPAFNRRCSEPILKIPFPPGGATTRAGPHCLARSQDDCSLKSRGQGYDLQPLKKQISDDSVLLGKLADPAADSLREGTAPSCNTLRSSNCSMESAASNQSEGSVFSSSPPASPPRPRKWTSIRKPRWGTTPRAVPETEGKRRSQSFRLDRKLSVKTLKKVDGSSFYQSSLQTADEALRAVAPSPCGLLSEPDSQSQLRLRRPRPLSATEVFQLPCRPPSYKQAVQSAGLSVPPKYRPLTVQHAQQEQGLRLPKRTASVSDDFLSSCPVNQYADCFTSAPATAAEEDQVGVAVVMRRHPFRQRAMSESASRGHLVEAPQRCSQPVFEEFSYAKESYV